MTAISSRASRIVLAEHRWFARTFARLLHYLNLIAKGFAEGSEMAHAAKKRYPFLDW